jgi:hypothetical protein
MAVEKKKKVRRCLSCQKLAQGVTAARGFEVVVAVLREEESSVAGASEKSHSVVSALPDVMNVVIFSLVWNHK